MTDEQERAYTVSLDTEDARLLSELLEGAAGGIGQTTGEAAALGLRPCSTPQSARRIAGSVLI